MITETILWTIYKVQIIHERNIRKIETCLIKN